MKKNALFLFVVILAGIFLWFFIHSFIKPSIPNTEDTLVADRGGYGVDPAQVRTRITDLLSTQGPQKAYARFVTDYQHADFGTQHNAAHIFGEELLVSEGIEGVRYCDPQFAFGCYHGFFTNAVSFEGISSITKLDEACSAVTYGDPSACRHGIGHGLVEYFGGGQLAKALELCKKTTQPNPIAGCTGGVFMEYNTPLRYSDEGVFFTEPRPLNPENPYAPCDTVAVEFRDSCYHELPQWWGQVYNYDFEKIGALCAGSPLESYVRNCYHGLGGVVAPSVNFDPYKVNEGCGLMPTEKGRYLCRASAAWSVMFDGAGYEDAALVCSESISEYYSPCPTEDADIM
ncbi:MAG: hypothetical protein ACJKTH_03855 [Patescibacteria group bacterium UBA2163]